jgi:hypothetical protein
MRAGAGSAGLAVRGVRVAAGAVLLHLKTIRVVTPVLLGDVVPLLALHARQRDLRTDISGGHGSAFLGQTTLQTDKSSRPSLNREIGYGCGSGDRT